MGYKICIAIRERSRGLLNKFYPERRYSHYHSWCTKKFRRFEHRNQKSWSKSIEQKPCFSPSFLRNKLHTRARLLRIACAPLSILGKNYDVVSHLQTCYSSKKKLSVTNVFVLSLLNAPWRQTHRFGVSVRETFSVWRRSSNGRIE